MPVRDAEQSHDASHAPSPEPSGAAKSPNPCQGPFLIARLAAFECGPLHLTRFWTYRARPSSLRTFSRSYFAYVYFLPILPSPSKCNTSRPFQPACMPNFDTPSESFMEIGKRVEARFVGIDLTNPAKKHLAHRCIKKKIFFLEEHLSPNVGELGQESSSYCLKSMVFRTVARMMLSIGCKVAHHGFQVHPVESIQVCTDSFLQIRRCMDALHHHSPSAQIARELW